jgi:TetR/AcrR family transcriptional regulator, repressor for uid operon
VRKLDPDKHAARRRGILAAAAACFADKGFHQTSTADLCAAAGTSPGNLFHYFPNKQAIIAAIVDQEAEETAAYVASLTGDEPLDDLLRFLDLALDLAADPAYVRLALETAAEASRDSLVAARVARNDAVLQEALRGLLRAAAARSLIDPALDPASTAAWIGALIDGLFNRVSLDPAFRPQEQRAALRRMALRFLAVGGDDGAAS